MSDTTRNGTGTGTGARWVWVAGTAVALTSAALIVLLVGPDNFLFNNRADELSQSVRYGLRALAALLLVAGAGCWTRVRS